VTSWAIPLHWAQKVSSRRSGHEAHGSARQGSDFGFAQRRPKSLTLLAQETPIGPGFSAPCCEVTISPSAGDSGEGSRICARANRSADEYTGVAGGIVALMTSE